MLFTRRKSNPNSAIEIETPYRNQISGHLACQPLPITPYPAANSNDSSAHLEPEFTPPTPTGSPGTHYELRYRLAVQATAC